MKTLGMIFLFLSISFFGFYIAEKYISVIKDLKRVELFIKNVLLCLESENMTVDEIFEFIKKSGDKNTNNFLDSISRKDFSQISKKSTDTNFCKNKTANSILEEIFSVLGKYSAKEQIKEISFCRNKIHAYYEKNERSFFEKAKLSRYSGILAAIFSVILFI